MNTFVSLVSVLFGELDAVKHLVYLTQFSSVSIRVSALSFSVSGLYDPIGWQ